VKHGRARSQNATEQDPKLGDARKRGIMLEAMSAWTLLMAGGDVAIMRHPEA
jgi:acetyl-CoA decarbonylase/synthase complex subunit delta